ncbi:hypothetical protein HNQ35_002279 [Cerasibacillus quisquiliarum]|uniref:DUF4352 domain-containing protein n=1 Tax=Cerasibacillus quisquiliarum TaxID=227865 RepID=A0A511V5N8_9BACI|nr:DUF4352 domain-containing protein [Cerasibacillus quisquiliarum]MBB5147062.1 hypothetical protein [Cerasibacillus quisquiliarum]GEN32512.1 hypothetical protein CQU01_27500 [Cerasibacillus quisquiliarum]
MRKLTLILTALLASMFLMSACSEDNSQSETLSKKINNDTKSEEKNEVDGEIPVYQIGETAVITSDLYDFDYEVTVTDFNLTKEVDGVKIEDYILGAEDDEYAKFAVIDITIKNISDESYVPNEMFSANFARENDRGGVTSEDEFFEVGDKELAPGEELEGHLVYVILLDDSETFTLKYEFMSDEETHFILPNPEK